VMFEIDVDEHEPADVIGDEPVWLVGDDDDDRHDNDRVVGWITSGGYAHYSGLSLAWGYVPAELADGAQQFEIEIIGNRRPARIQKEPPVDPSGLRMRA
ncbi:MAG TPA: glycine cleavage T C-terminal barrel domain-containing protein, partial [Ilumatobacter sp.]|nr:glycine cleavage T C-terminal barrel domain-containing protein [Ilumatobacter sp.]